MDRQQLLTICITAVVSIVAKEIVTWLWGLMKVGLGTAHSRVRYRMIFNRPNLEVLISATQLPIWPYFLYVLLWHDEPVTGKMMLQVIGAFFLMVISVPVLLMDSSKARANLKRLREQIGSSHSS